MSYDDLIVTLERARDDQGLSIEALANRMDRHYTQIWRWLRGGAHPVGPNLVELAHALGYDLALVPREDA